MTPPHPITRRTGAAPVAAVAAVVVLGATASCVSKKDAAEARASVYDTEFAVAFSEALAAVRESYPNLEEDPTAGTIRTAWHQVQVEAPQDDSTAARDPAGLSGGGTPGLTQSSGIALKRTFIRFDVSVVGGRPWQIRVQGRASRWDPGNAVPVELRGADAPPWLAGRTDALVIAIHKRLRAHARRAPQQVDDAPAAQAVDLTAFGPIPAQAAEAVARVRRALTARDPAALRAAVAADVVWSFGAAPGADAAIATWQADPEVLEQMAASIDAGCRPASATEVTCPPAATEQPGYLGWRAVFAPRGKAWTLTAFVQGD